MLIYTRSEQSEVRARRGTSGITKIFPLRFKILAKMRKDSKDSMVFTNFRIFFESLECYHFMLSLYNNIT